MRQSGRSKNNTPLVATCISPSGETLALVGKYEYWVYTLAGGYQASLKPKYKGKFESDGEFKSGLEIYDLKSQGRIMSDQRKREFECAAISDNLLVIGASESGCLLFFSIGEGEQGRCTFKSEHTNRTIRKLVFSLDSTELAVLFSIPSNRKEICRVYSVGRFPMNIAPRTSTVPELDCLPDCDFDLDMTYQTRKIPTTLYRYIPRDASFSFNGRKIVICTKHADGTALVFILSKDNHNTWSWRRDRLVMNRLEAGDMGCLGFTGVSLYFFH